MTVYLKSAVREELWKELAADWCPPALFFPSSSEKNVCKTWLKNGLWQHLNLPCLSEKHWPSFSVQRESVVKF